MFKVLVVFIVFALILGIFMVSPAEVKAENQCGEDVNKHPAHSPGGDNQPIPPKNATYQCADNIPENGR